MSHTTPHRALTSELRSHDRNAYLQFVAANVCNTSAKILNPDTKHDATTPHLTQAFSVEARAFNASDFTIMRIKTKDGNIRSERTVSDIQRDRRLRYAVNLPIRGFTEMKQLGRETVNKPGTLLMLSGLEPLTFKKMTDHDGLTVLLPPRFVDERLTSPEDICCKQLVDHNGLQRLAFTSLAALEDEASDMSADDLSKAISIFAELLILALDHLTDVRSSASPIRAANLTRIKRIIRARCENPDLSLPDIARECNISLRYLHNLFRDDGRTAGEYILHERLRRARRLLESASPATTTVTDVCFATGFSNLSHFSAAFRRVFSVSPVDVLKGR